MNQTERAKRVAENAQELAGLLERVAEVKAQMRDDYYALIDEEVAAAVTATTANAVTADRPRRGRPPGSGKKETGITVIGRQQTVKENTSGEWKDLPTLLSHIAETQNRPLKLADFVQLARAAGYTSDAKDFPNMVYQSLLKLVKRGVLEKDQESRDYHYIGKAA